MAKKDNDKQEVLPCRWRKYLKGDRGLCYCTSPAVISNEPFDPEVVGCPGCVIRNHLPRHIILPDHVDKGPKPKISFSQLAVLNTKKRH